MRSARLALAGFGSVWAILLSAGAASADESWTITLFHSDISVAPVSTMTVTETIQVDFGSLRKHGIFRTISLRYRYNSSQDRFYRLEVKSVADGTKPIPYEDSISSDNEVIKIGDPGVLVTGA